jgi:4-amino-4-deoxy-L-arabinose transferase-like glycosyltransferase
MFADKNRLSAIIFWASALLFLFWGLGDRGLWASEGRSAEITREMFLSADFLHPTINGEPYFDKPLLSYWFIAIVSAITGRLDEWTVRLPSAISGLLALWATTYLGRKLWSREVGRTAGWINHANLTAGNIE